MAYKKDQGRLARMAAFWSTTALAFYGCWSLKDTLGAAWGGTLSAPLIASMKKVPILGLPFNAATLIAAAVFVAATIALYRWQHTPKVADLLIETEAELRKVTWPTLPEAFQSSLVVIVCVLF